MDTSRDRPPRARPRRSGPCRRRTSRACGRARTRSSGSARARAGRGSGRDPTRGPNSACENFTGESPRRTLSEIASWSTVNATVRRGSADIGDLRHRRFRMAAQYRAARVLGASPAASRILCRRWLPRNATTTWSWASNATATDAEIKRAFRKLAQQWHPDVSTDPDAPERFKEINEAYQVLSDPERRQRVRHVRSGRRRRCGRRVRGWLRRVLRHLRRVLRRRGRGRCRTARSPAAWRRPALRPPHHVRGGRQGHREGDRVPGRAAVRDVSRDGRQGGDRGDDVSAVQRPRRSAQRRARPCSARWST